MGYPSWLWNPQSNPIHKPTVAIIGASKDPAKHSHRAIQAHLARGYEVYPVNPRETEILGLKTYPSVAEIPVPLDRVTVYLPPAVGLTVIGQIARKNPKELFLNPGSESEELVQKARALGLSPILACSITDLEVNPNAPPGV